MRSIRGVVRVIGSTYVIDLVSITLIVGSNIAIITIIANDRCPRATHSERRPLYASYGDGEWVATV